MRPIDPTVPLGPDLVTCPRCSAPNVPRRRQCGRCGADLISGEMPKPAPLNAPEPAPSAPRPAPAQGAKPQVREGRASAVNPPVRTSPRFEDILSDDSAEFEETAEPHRRPWLVIAVVIAGLALGTALGVLMVAGIGPFGPDESPSFFFDPGQYEEAAIPLLPASVGASSVRPGDAATSYGPSRLADDDRATAWLSQPGTTGATYLDFGFEAPVWVTEVTVATGDQSGEDAFAASARPIEFLLTFDGTRPVRVQLQDAPGAQRVALETPRLTSAVRFELETAAGPDDASSAVSEVVITGYRADDADAERWRAAYG
jgi:hypothetical protein